MILLWPYITDEEKVAKQKLMDKWNKFEYHLFGGHSQEVQLAFLGIAFEPGTLKVSMVSFFIFYF